MNAEKFLNSLINYERIKLPNYDFKLDNFRNFLNTIGNPEKKLHNVILIAGTKGKGSTATFIESGLRADGLKTGLFTSPHILSIRERIKVNNKEIKEVKEVETILNIQVMKKQKAAIKENIKDLQDELQKIDDLISEFKKLDIE